MIHPNTSDLLTSVADIYNEGRLDGVAEGDETTFVTDERQYEAKLVLYGVITILRDNPELEAALNKAHPGV